ncbi:TetR/AcrR family transcriptional regulator [Rossellomorea sp. BNER]|uniref:TetR/AcrR family transcriptional regulator n=1 Tax=Rossellomorea sp. BNER TaxID=2962031 RepID=UPI003AF2D39F|nr:TetR/AcrR family transcriptional regulator [Rossellomorea sp. BNER]
MPKIVDHEKRKKLIAEATWRVILERGMEGATVRNIAKEAGLSLGALRHYFSTHDDLLVYAMELVKENAINRIVQISKQDLPPKERVLKILLEIVPTNEITMTEAEVWFAFIAHARHKKNVIDANQDGVYLGVERLVHSLENLELLRDGLDIVVETERLYAIVDGLALHAILEPERLDKEKITRVLTLHLQSICKGET